MAIISLPHSFLVKEHGNKAMIRKKAKEHNHNLSSAITTCENLLKTFDFDDLALDFPWRGARISKWSISMSSSTSTTAPTCFCVERGL